MTSSTLVREEILLCMLIRLSHPSQVEEEHKRRRKDGRSRLVVGVIISSLIMRSLISWSRNKHSGWNMKQLKNGVIKSCLKSLQTLTKHILASCCKKASLGGTNDTSSTSSTCVNSMAETIATCMPYSKLTKALKKSKGIQTFSGRSSSRSRTTKNTLTELKKEKLK